MALLLLVFDLVALSACRARESAVEAALTTRTLHVALEAEPRDLDPQLQVAFSDMHVSLALFEGLTAVEEQTSAPVPAAAERWEVSADGRRWTFFLRPNLRWSDGQPLTAEDFVFSLRRALAPSQAFEYAYVLFPIAGAEAFNAGEAAAEDVGISAEGSDRLVLTLAEPYPALPAILALPIAFPVPRHVIEPLTAQGDERRWTRAGTLVGNGAFRLVEWRPNQRIVTEQNPAYWDAGNNRLSGVIFYPYENASAQEAAFRAGQIHVTTTVPVARLDTYRQDQPSVLREDPFLATGFLRFNTTRPPFDDPRVRQAFSLAIDRDALVRHVLRAGQPAASLTPPGTGDYTPPAVAKTDVDRARQLLAEAGFPDGKGFPAIELMSFSLEVNQRLLEALQQRWRTVLGVAPSLALKEQRVWLDDERQLNYSISNARWIGDYVDPSTFLDVFLSTSGNNATGWKDESYDTAIRTANAEADPRRRADLYRAAEMRLLESAPIAPLYHGASVYLLHPSVHGWDASLLGFHRYQRVWLEPRAGVVQ